MERVEQRRLSALRDNRSASSVGEPETEDQEEAEEVEVEEVKPEPVDRETLRMMVNYCETSDGEEEEEDDEQWKKIR